jgi:PIN domain nuclease of toxin-antitoxin system
VRLLLDTHTLLWQGISPARLSARARQLLDDASTERLVSVATLWEMAIKVGLGKLALRQDSFERLIDEGLAAAKATLLHIEPRHVKFVATLPHHHRDPFDRLLVAQALAENVPLLSSDTELDPYGVQRLW